MGFFSCYPRIKRAKATLDLRQKKAILDKFDWTHKLVCNPHSNTLNSLIT